MIRPLASNRTHEGHPPRARAALEAHQGHQVRDVHHPARRRPPAFAADDDESLWFFMSKKGDPVDELKADPIVNLVYADPSADTYVSVSGTAAMIEDAAKKEQLWSKLAAAWFPGGPGDPDLALVEVRIA